MSGEIKMKPLLWVVRWLAYPILLISTFAVGAAYAAPRICNSTNIQTSVAIAWYGSTSPGLHSKGWYVLQPGGCTYPFPADSYDAHRYYFAYNAGDPQHPELSRAWTSDTYQGGQLSTDGLSFCIGDNGATYTGSTAFYFADASNSCSPPNLRRGFVHIEESGEEDSDVYLTWQNARLGSATW
jgi:hypothetical protein